MGRMGLALALAAAAAAARGAEPAAAAEDAKPAKPAKELVQRLRNGPEIISIVHWGLNTYTDREWGYGNASPSVLNPPAFDPDGIVKAIKDGGIGGVVLVAKHHDGFCLWPTKTTDYNISKSPFRGGKGDYVKEMEQACRRAGLEFGVYVSPWDRNSASYGSSDYVDIYHKQYFELCGGAYGKIFEAWFDGANGGTGWYGGKPGRRRIPGGYYRFEALNGELRRLQPGITFFGGSPDFVTFNWPGNERGFVPEDRQEKINSVKDRYLVYEADFPLRPGWFYHKKDRGKSKSGKMLAKLYFTSVGRGATMNIGISPNLEGGLDKEDVDNLAEFKRIKDALFGHETRPGEPFNIVELREDVSGGAYGGGWTLKEGGKAIASGKTIGWKRLIPFGETHSGGSPLVFEAPGDVRGKVEIRRYLAPQKLLNEVLGIGPADETETAKRMKKAGNK